VTQIKDKEIKEHVKKTYGEIAQTAESCGSSCGCGCGPSSTDTALQIGYSKNELGSIPKGSNMGLGCGNPTALASLKKGETVLDLGSGGGIDAFIASKKVGAKGKVIGVDMTEEMIQKAKTTAKKNGYDNVEFKLGEIESLPLEDNSVDVVISNCVVNLAPDKEKVYNEVYRVLKPGGRIMISDIVTEEELPEEVRQDFESWAGCVAGALVKSKYLDTIRKAGFTNTKIVSQTTLSSGVPQELDGKITSIQVEAYKK
jgi:ubiquinone/menaquinone biosynthesis C-methylase UbiE